MVISDWRGALGDIPEQALDRAFAERMRTDDRRKPIPGEIRKRALEFVAKPPLTVADNRGFPPVVVDEDELKRRRRQQARLRREFPMLKQMPRAE